METIAVIPIFVNAGAAVLPTIVAAVVSVALVMFKPRELIRLLGRRPAVPGVSAAVIAIGLGMTIWCLTSVFTAHAARQGGVAATVPFDRAPPAVVGNRICAAGCRTDLGGYAGLLACRVFPRDLRRRGRCWSGRGRRQGRQTGRRSRLLSGRYAGRNYERACAPSGGR